MIQRMLANKKHKSDIILPKTFTEDFMAGKKSKNIGQRNRYFVKDSHPAIFAVEVFDKVQEAMAKRARLVSKEDGTVETSGSKYNGKYLLGNLLVYGDCGAPYRRRTERCKVVWHCATRIEKGREACSYSPTLDEAWVQEMLSTTVFRSGAYDEVIIRNNIDRIQVFDTYILIFRTDGSQDKRLFQNY